MIQELTLSHKRQIIITLVLTIVYCKSFNVLFSNRRIACGGNSLQSKLKFLKLPNFRSTFFIFLLFASNFSSFDLLRTAVPRKRVQRYRFNLKPPNFSATFFKQILRPKQQHTEIKPFNFKYFFDIIFHLTDKHQEQRENLKPNSSHTNRGHRALTKVLPYRIKFVFLSDKQKQIDDDT